MKPNKQSERHSRHVSCSECRKMDRKTAYYMLKKIKRMPVLDKRITDQRSERFNRLAIFFLLAAIFATVGYMNAHTNAMSMLYTLTGMFMLTHHIICAVESYNYSLMTDEGMLQLKHKVDQYTYVKDVMNDRLKGRSQLTQKEGDMLANVCHKLAAHDSVEHVKNNNDEAKPRNKTGDDGDQDQMVACGVYQRYSLNSLTCTRYAVHGLRSGRISTTVAATDDH